MIKKIVYLLMGLVEGKWFWFFVITCALITKSLFYIECRSNDLLALNQLKAMDMEKFLNWSRILVEENRWLTDFSTSDTRSPAAVSYSCFYQSPLYPYFMALVYVVTGQDPAFSYQEFGYQVIIVVQLILGIVMLWPLHQVLLRVVSQKIARLATALFVFCDTMVFFQTILLRAFLLSLIYLFVIYFLLVLHEQAKKRHAIAVGFFMGCAWVTKANFMALVPVIMVWLFIFRPSHIRQSLWIKRMALVILLLSTIIALPVARNMILRSRYHSQMVAQHEVEVKTPVPLFKITTRGPYSYINGNSYHSADGPISQLPVDIHNPGLGQGIGWDFNRLKNQFYGALFYSKESHFARSVLDPDGNNDNWDQSLRELWPIMKLVWAEHSQKQSWFERFWPMMSNKLMAFFNGYETPNNTNINLHKKFTQSMKMFFLSSSFICAACLFGVVVLIKAIRRPEIALLLGFIGLYIGLTIAFYFISRFRVPILPLMYVVGVAGIYHVLRQWALFHVLKKIVVIFLVVFCVCVAWPRDVRGGMHQENFKQRKGIRYADYYNYALGKQVLARSDRSTKKIEQALEITREGIQQLGALVFSPLLRIHFWALSSLSHAVNEKYQFCLLLEELYQGRHRNELYTRRGRSLVMAEKEHAALYTLALDYLIQNGDHQQNQLRKNELKLMYQIHGENKLFEYRYGIVYNENLAHPRW